MHGPGLVVAAVSAQAQTLRQLHSFDGATEGTSTSAPLTQGRDGLFYGVNGSDGPHGGGTLFRMTPNGTLLVLHAFTGGADGGRSFLANSWRGPTAFCTGRPRGEGGLHSRGVAFRITLDGDLTVLHAGPPIVPRSSR